MLTPTTKAPLGEHDRALTFNEVVPLLSRKQIESGLDQEGRSRRSLDLILDGISARHNHR